MSKQDIFYLTYLNFTSTDVRSSKKGESRPPLRQYLMDGDFFIGAAVGTTLAKLALRYSTQPGIDTKRANSFCAESMLIITSILNLGKSGTIKLISVLKVNY